MWSSSALFVQSFFPLEFFNSAEKNEGEMIFRRLSYDKFSVSWQFGYVFWRPDNIIWRRNFIADLWRPDSISLFFVLSLTVQNIYTLKITTYIICGEMCIELTYLARFSRSIFRWQLKVRILCGNSSWLQIKDSRKASEQNRKPKLYLTWRIFTLNFRERTISYDVTAAILVFQNKGTAGNIGVPNHSSGNGIPFLCIIFCFSKPIWSLVV